MNNTKKIITMVNQLNDIDKTITSLKKQRHKFSCEISELFLERPDASNIIEDEELNVQIFRHLPKTETFESYEKEIKPERYHYQQLDKEKEYTLK